MWFRSYSVFLFGSCCLRFLEGSHTAQVWETSVLFNTEISVSLSRASLHNKTVLLFFHVVSALLISPKIANVFHFRMLKGRATPVVFRLISDKRDVTSDMENGRWDSGRVCVVCLIWKGELQHDNILFCSIHRTITWAVLSVRPRGASCLAGIPAGFSFIYKNRFAWPFLNQHVSKTKFLCQFHYAEPRY